METTKEGKQIWESAGATGNLLTVMTPACAGAGGTEIFRWEKKKKGPGGVYESVVFPLPIHIVLIESDRGDSSRHRRLLTHNLR